MVILGPDGSDHQRHALAAQPRLHAVPDAGHCCAVEHWPQRAPDAKGGSRDDGEADVVCGTDPAGHADEYGSDEVSDPDAQPGLPPGQPVVDHCRGYHPGVLPSLSVSMRRDLCLRQRFSRTILNESATQNPTKFHGPHRRRCGSTSQTAGQPGVPMNFFLSIFFEFSPSASRSHSSTISLTTDKNT